jgi:hypothetical protein
MIQCTGQDDQNPRIAAGGPFSDDVLSCQLKPLTRSDHPVACSDDQWALLQQTFPTGVCDYDKLGVGQQGGVAWMTYMAADASPIYGGVPMAAAP